MKPQEVAAELKALAPEVKDLLFREGYGKAPDTMIALVNQAHASMVALSRYLRGKPLEKKGKKGKKKKKKKKDKARSK